VKTRVRGEETSFVLFPQPRVSRVEIMILHKQIKMEETREDTSLGRKSSTRVSTGCMMKGTREDTSSGRKSSTRVSTGCMKKRTRETRVQDKKTYSCLPPTPCLTG